VPLALQHLRFVEQGLFNDLLFPLLGHCDIDGELSGFEHLWQRIGRPIRPLNRINSPEGLAALRDSAPDLIVSMRYGGFLKEEAIAVPRFGVINLHAGLLPGYRGLMATFWSMLHGEREYGCTLHYILDTGVDTGPVISQRRLSVEPRRSYLWHVLNLYPHATAMVAEAIAQIERTGSAPSAAQGGAGEYYSLPGAEELMRFEAAGLRLVDAEDILSLAQRYTGCE
jgi:methionyl-tRNA formyltransferase